MYKVKAKSMLLSREHKYITHQCDPYKTRSAHEVGWGSKENNQLGGGRVWM